MLKRLLTALTFLGFCATGALANNPGDPLFCQPQEGTTYIINNSGSGTFTADPDCYGNFNPTPPLPSFPAI
jgi:hypothetical protein